ncbi:hypothetical protein CO115_03335 [Candidatus Falkowbacteria bacterium CG_4_9_14_3_um_filter_36_9]|uniref:Cell division protein FtsL n=2 Tax=Candidatus Falkowiibacteriota TaxID=1752728 RepID=A0A1J4T469_9BACT|nr:MAG: hypothetical protein AUJ27_03830 [Candidatus Falkowbacteria bacterium CG1_02_37_44]PIV50528.1 MAG: hypothetical protein COS18_04820 [Candidatus Falkowbacteria bacterium CG02_land_8_20_14_3_00_36_14]PIX11476.1 MAG: hypothetical protein COZ73_02540 [Candidatus Falkowbacteria bacterium CG_4_8_14_3_um_filter_36_11]PJA10360.1 MAG: hypothetical protein COX67_04740 [Candidatus Falkowbacteria bacterium CG_4_10_14_0_2_um_filter_36_22]PJB19051.1 MAG: hypothetical protein CO115_03335 [Candidatus F
MIKTKKGKNSFCKNKINRKFNIKIFNNILLILIILLGVYYIIGINDLSIKGFQLLETKKIMNELNDENSDLEATTMSLQSYNNLNSRVKDLSMIPAGNIDYLSSKNDIVAKK